MSGERIHVVGPAHRVAIVGALLARRWVGEGRQLVLVPDTEPRDGSSIVARPDQAGFHAELGLTLNDLVKHAGASPIFAVEVACADGTAALPYSPFGMQRSGVEFHQFWQRGNGYEGQPDLTEFSLALAMQSAPDQIRAAAIGKLPLQFGLKLDRARYTELLLKSAADHGARMGGSGEEEASDLTIGCGLSDGISCWSGKTLRIAQHDDISGVDWQLCANAARRFLNLAARLSGSENELREYTRLCAFEAERIADMRALLSEERPQETSRTTLKRKLDVFAACGRIPTEDFEFFSQPEWLAALWARGIRPRRFDRLAMRIPERELLEWLSKLHREIAQFSQRGQAA